MSRELSDDGDVLRWYEVSLPLSERRRRGHFSTPPGLVEQILNACGYTSDADLSHLRVLDPACGSGNFLAGAACRLMHYGQHVGLPAKKCASLISRNIRGFDPDPIACFLAEMQLHTTLNDPCISRSLHPHIHQADGLTLPWQDYEGVDLLLANPPYLSVKNTDLSGYRSAQQRGQIDSYLLFLDLALQIVRPSGWIGLVLPDPVLARANATKERKRLLEHFTLHHLWHLSGAFAAQVGAVVLIAQKCPAKHIHTVSWTREKWDRTDRRGTNQGTSYQGAIHCAPTTTTTIPQSLFLQQPHAELRYLLNREEGHRIQQLHDALDADIHLSERRFAPLSDFLSIRRGEELGRDNKYIIPFDPEATCSDPPRGGQGNMPLLRGGGDIRPYGTPHTKWAIARQFVKKPLERYLSPKLLVVKSTGRLQAALDTQGHVVLQTLYLLHPRFPEMGEDDLLFFLALLNSRLLQQYVYVLHTAYKWVQPQIEQHVLARLPIPLVPEDEKLPIIERSRRLMLACGEQGSVVEWGEHISSLYDEQERAIDALYDTL